MMAGIAFFFIGAWLLFALLPDKRVGQPEETEPSVPDYAGEPKADVPIYVKWRMAFDMHGNGNETDFAEWRNKMRANGLTPDYLIARYIPDEVSASAHYLRSEP